MQLIPLFAATLITITPALAEDTRQLDAHEHGVGQLNIAFDGQKIALELHAPGADIVGFEYAAESRQDRAAVDAAVTALAKPLELFALPASAGCSVVQASAGLESEEGHDAHKDHADAAGHTEFHAEYLLTCADPAAITQITFAYFDAFPNALEVEVQLISDAGATSFEVGREAPILDLRGMF